MILVVQIFILQGLWVLFNHVHGSQDIKSYFRAFMRVNLLHGLPICVMYGPHD